MAEWWRALRALCSESADGRRTGCRVCYGLFPVLNDAYPSRGERACEVAGEETSRGALFLQKCVHVGAPQRADAGASVLRGAESRAFFDLVAEVAVIGIAENDHLLRGRDSSKEFIHAVEWRELIAVRGEKQGRDVPLPFEGESCGNDSG